MPTPVDSITVVELEVRYELAKSLGLVEDVIELETFSTQFVEAFKQEAEALEKRARHGKK